MIEVCYHDENITECVICQSHIKVMGASAVPHSGSPDLKHDYVFGVHPSWFQPPPIPKHHQDASDKHAANVAVKADSEKCRLELIDAGVMEEMAWILTFGAKKYSDHNWAKGFSWSRLLGATLRHLFAELRGEDVDKESGRPHWAHAMAELMFYGAHRMQKLGIDDRRKT